jgi:hypothetical protein
MNVYMKKNYTINMQNLKYYILLMGLGDAERSYLAMARMEDCHGGNLVLWLGKSVIIHRN